MDMIWPCLLWIFLLLLLIPSNLTSYYKTTDPVIPFDLGYYRQCDFTLTWLSRLGEPLLGSSIIESHQFGQTWEIWDGTLPNLNKLQFYTSKGQRYFCTLFVYIDLLHDPRHSVISAAGNLEANVFLILQRSGEGEGHLPTYLEVFSYWNAPVFVVDLDLKTPPGLRGLYFLCSHCPLENRVWKLGKRMIDLTPGQAFQYLIQGWRYTNWGNFKGHGIRIYTREAHGESSLEEDCQGCPSLKVTPDLLRNCHSDMFITESMASKLNFTPVYLNPMDITHDLGTPYLFYIELYLGGRRTRRIFQEKTEEFRPLYCLPKEEVVRDGPGGQGRGVWRLILILFDSSGWVLSMSSFGIGGVIGSIRCQLGQCRLGWGLLMGIALLMRQGPPPSTLRFDRKMSLLLGLSGIILAMSYEGLITSRLIAPSKPHSFQNLTELLDNGFRFYVRVDSEISEDVIREQTLKFYERRFRATGNLHRIHSSFYHDPVPKGVGGRTNTKRVYDFLGNRTMGLATGVGRIAILSDHPNIVALLVQSMYPGVLCLEVENEVTLTLSPLWDFQYRYSGLFSWWIGILFECGFTGYHAELRRWFFDYNSLRLGGGGQGHDGGGGPISLSLSGGTSAIFLLLLMTLTLWVGVLVLEVIWGRFLVRRIEGRALEPIVVSIGAEVKVRVRR